MDSFRVSRLGAFVAPLVVVLLIGGSAAVAAVTAGPSSATIYATDASAWHNAANTSSPNAAIAPGGTVTWENRDSNNSHPVECVQRESNATCPWSGSKDLPPAQKTITGTTASRASITFQHSGTFAFRCVVHPSQMTGTIVVGSGKPASTAKPTATSTSAAHTQSSARASTPATAAPSSAPSVTASVQPSAKPGSGKAPAPRTSVLAAGPQQHVSSNGKSGTGAVAIPAILLIAFVIAGHIARAKTARSS